MGFGSGIRDPGSGKNLFRIPDPGVKKAPDPGSWIRNTEEQRSAVDSKTDPGCLSRILDPNISIPDPDPGSKSHLMSDLDPHQTFEYFLTLNL